MQTIFFSGIGGIGMSALARFLHGKGYTVMGSDNTDAPLLHELEAEGIKILRQQAATNLPSDCTELIYSEAIPEDHPERQEASKRKIPALSYFQKLGKISQDFFTICVAGTHGKSGTTVMAGLALEAAGVDPTVLVGTKVFEWGNRNFRSGKSNVLLVEACEYRESFLALRTDVIVLTNVEPDHLDYYKTKDRYFRGFQKLLGKLTEEGMLIADFTDPVIQQIARKHKGKEIFTHDFLRQVPPLQIPGEHYRQNASKVLALCAGLKIDLAKPQEALHQYRGAWRRFEYKGEKNGILVWDDYAHHPTEIMATLRGFISRYPQKKKWVIFQPHQYSRTADFLTEFGKSFHGVEEILIPNIYRVRDDAAELQRVSPEILVAEIAKNLQSGQRVRYSENFTKTEEILRTEARLGDVILTMGAGPINEVAEAFLGQ